MSDARIDISVISKSQIHVGCEHAKEYRFCFPLLQKPQTHLPTFEIHIS
jgi:hypothetical protein